MGKRGNQQLFFFFKYQTTTKWWGILINGHARLNFFVSLNFFFSYKKKGKEKRWS